MEMTNRYTAWLLSLAVRDNLVVQIAGLVVILALIWLLGIKGRPWEPPILVGLVVVFYVSLIAYVIMGL